MNPLFDITSQHIGKLNDTDLRTLVGLLCEADLTLAGMPARGINWGGAQDAADGGIDVSIENPDIPSKSFIPRGKTGFQVKKPDMPPSAILKEMKPNGVLRESIKSLFTQQGAYIIVSAKSVTPQTLRRRIAEMNKIINDDGSNAIDHCVDYYDGSKLASWVRQHPSVTLWLRNKVGEPLNGWRSFEDWVSNGSLNKQYILDDGIRLRYAQNSRGREANGTEALQKVRSLLKQHRTSLRLVGLSGVGKTRFAQAVFEEQALEDALPPSLAIYTDMSYSPNPTPVVMAEQLIATKSRAILIADNCPPDLHRILTSICGQNESRLSLITIEYDVRDDLPEETDVLILEPSSDSLIEKLIIDRNPTVGRGNAARIAEFANGNAKVALTLASTMDSAETLSSFRDEELFLRIFKQRNPDDKRLLESAQVLSLVYSFDGRTIDEPDSELKFLSSLVNIPIIDLLKDVAELERRNLIQRRGIWRAILPHAFANRLARRGLRSIPPEYLFKQFLLSKSDRLLQSFSRRLGYLHDEPSAVSIGLLFLQGGSQPASASTLPIQMSVLENIAPVIPSQIIEYLERRASSEIDFTSRNNPQFSSITDLLLKLAYDPEHFDRVAVILVQFALSENPDETHNSVRRKLQSMFQLYLSGTHANIAQRSNVIKHLISAGDSLKKDLGLSLLDQTFTTESFTGHASSFGARPRDYGYQPKTIKEVHAWYERFVKYCTSLTTPDNPASHESRKLLASHFRRLWRTGIYDVLCESAKEINRVKHWEEGWLGVKSVIQYDKSDQAPKNMERLYELEKLLRPKSTTSQTRVLVLTNAWDMIDIDSNPLEGKDFVQLYRKGNERARELGATVAQDKEALQSLLPDLLQHDYNERLYQFGLGLADSSTDHRSTWDTIHRFAKSIPDERLKFDMVRGFAHSLADKDSIFYEELMDYMLENRPFAIIFPSLQPQILDRKATNRILRCLELEIAPIVSFRLLAYATFSEDVDERVRIELLNRIVHKDKGLLVVIEYLYLKSIQDNRLFLLSSAHKAFIDKVFSMLDFQAVSVAEHIDHMLAHLIEISHMDEDAAVDLCWKLRVALQTYLTRHHYPETTKVLAKKQPIAFLNVFTAKDEENRDNPLEIFRSDHSHPYSSIPDDTIVKWCEENHRNRIPTVLRQMPPFHISLETKELSWRPALKSLLQLTKNIAAALESLTVSMHSTWFGDSMVEEVRRQIVLLHELTTHENIEVQNWAKQTRDRLEQEIENIAELQENKSHWRYESFE